MKNRKPVLLGKYGETVVRRAIADGEIRTVNDVADWCKRTERTGSENDYISLVQYLLKEA